MAAPTSHPGPPSRESRRHFERRVDAALDDADLQRALRHAMPELRAKRKRAFESFDFERGRQDLKRRRMENLARLPELLEEFRERLEEAGGRLHEAATADEARRIIGEICLSAGAGTVTKSKSMATEEIGLNQHLRALGMDVVETDLGERLVQLMDSRPSHMIAPAIHLTKEDAARVLGVAPRVEDIQAEARRTLREKFVSAAVGISGANAAIAETGTVMLVTNEGNADLTTTLPPVHVAVFGVDKLVAGLDDAVAMLRMLARSGTGQRMTSYVNWITGPSRSADIEQSLAIGVHGPRELHCVVVDNGRTRMAADPLFAEALACIRCGACANACPPFMAVGGHQFGHVYTGPIGLVLTPFHHGLEAVELPQSLCAQCDACQEICPVDIPLPRQILEHRRKSRRPIAKDLALDLWGHPTIAAAALRAAAPAAALAHAPVRPALRPFRSRVHTGSPGGSGDPVTIFASCMVDGFDPAPGAALERILRAAGFRITFPPRQWCCGLVAANAGRFEQGAEMAARLAEALAGSEGPIVTPSASCFGAATMDAPEWGPLPEGYQSVVSRMRDSTRFVLALLESRPDLLRTRLAPARVAYHDSCQTLRRLGLKDEPRKLLQLAGYEVVEVPDVAACCGFGGTFSAEWPRVADRIAGWKLEAVAETGCQILASDNPGCLVHLAGAARRRGAELRVVHTLDLVAERLA